MTTPNAPTPPSSSELRFYRRMLLFMTGVASAFGIAMLAPYLDDREVVKHKELSGGVIIPWGSGVGAPDDSLARPSGGMGVGMSGEMPPGSAPFLEKMRKDPIGTVIELYDEDPKNSLGVLLNACSILLEKGKYKEVETLLNRAQRDHAGEVDLAQMEKRLAERRASAPATASAASPAVATGQVNIPPGADPNLVQKMATDPRGTVMAMYQENPQDFQVLLNAAQIYGSRGKIDQALEMVEIADKDHPNQPGIIALKKRLIEAKNGGTPFVSTLGEPMGIDASAAAPILEMPAGREMPHDDAHSAMDSAPPAPNDETLAQLRESVKQNPQNFQVAFEAGALYLQSRKYSESREFLEHARTLNPVHEDTLILLATVNAVEDKFEEARTLLNGVIERNPRNGTALSNLGYLTEIADQDPEKALALYKRALAPEAEATEDIRQEARESIARLESAKAATGPATEP